VKASAYLYSDYGGGKWYMNKMGYNTPLNSENKFSFFTAPGTYRVQFMIAANGRNYSVFGPKCVVVAGVKTVCDAVFPTDKFNFKVKNLDGTPYVGSASVNFSLTTTNEQITGLQTTLNVAESDSFTVPLMNGDYKFRINPRTDSATVGVSREFTFSVSSSRTKHVTENLFSRPAIGHRMISPIAYQTTRSTYFIHDAITRINARTTTYAFVLQAFTDIDTGRTNLHAHGAVYAIA
jgi:hypothetical protein